MTEGEARAFIVADGHGDVPVDRCRGIDPTVGGAPEAMAVAIARHYELLDEAIVGHGGVRPVEQGEGDSVVGAFSRASDAVAAAVAAQRAFARRAVAGGRRAAGADGGAHRRGAAARADGNYVGQTSTVRPDPRRSGTAVRC